MKLIQKLIISSIISAIGLAGCHSGGSNQLSGVQAPPVGHPDGWIPDGFYKINVENIVYDEKSGILSGYLKDKTPAGNSFVPEQKDRFITFNYRGLCNDGSEVELEHVYDPIWRDADIWVKMKCTSPMDIGHGNYDPSDRNPESLKYYLGAASTYFYNWHNQKITGYEWISPYSAEWGDFRRTTWMIENFEGKYYYLMTFTDGNFNHANFDDSVWYNRPRFYTTSMKHDTSFRGAIFLSRMDKTSAELSVDADAVYDADYKNVIGITYFDGAYLKYANLLSQYWLLRDSRANFTHASFRYAHLDHAIFSKNWTMNDEYNGKFDYTDFAGASLTYADFTNASLTLANFANANLSNAILRRTWLARAKFNGANLTQANLDNTGIDTYSRYNHRPSERVQETNFIGATLIRASLLNGNFRGSDFSGAALISARMEKSYFTDASFRNAKLHNASLKDSAVDRADFSGAILSNTVWVDGTTKTGVCAESSIGQCNLISANSPEAGN